MHLCRTRNRHNPRLLCQQPGECNLSRRHILLPCELANQLHDGLIRVAVLRREAGDNIAKITLVKLRILVDGSGEEALAQWTEWHEADAELLQGRYGLLLRFSPPQRVFALQRRHRLYFVGSANRLCASLRQPKVFHLALLDQVPDSSRHVFNRNLVINAMLVEKINDVGFQALERCLGNLLNVLWPAIQTSLLTVFDFESEFGGDYDLIAERSQGLSHEFLISKGP